MTTRIVARGIGASNGIAFGKTLVIRSDDFNIFYVSIKDSDIPIEIKRFHSAVASAKQQLQSIKDKVTETLGKDHAYILDAQMCALDDPMLIKNTVVTIREHRVNAEWAVHRTVGQITRRFAEIKDQYLSERVNDIEDVTKRIIQNLSGNQPKDLSALESPAVLVSARLAPSEAIQLQPSRILGIVLDAGGVTSHTAIVARSLGIPSVIGLHNFSAAVVDQTPILVDGGEGLVILNPTENEIEQYKQKQSAFETHVKNLLATKDIPAKTADGVRVHLGANIEFPSDVSVALAHGAEEIGLYRTEFLYLNKSPNLPTEEDHFQTYKQVLEEMGEKPVIIRTFDLGGEKFFHRVLQHDNFHPVLGLRAIRYCLKNEPLFISQLRGLLRASVFGNLKVMVPMITTLNEIRQTKEMIKNIKLDLAREGKPFKEDLPFGIMIEVPSAAMAVDIFAKEVDFLSVGTNDLIQYTLAIERGNDMVAYLYDPLHPAILRMLKQIADASEKAGIEAHICGEIASSPLYTELLVGFGYKHLSMNARYIPEIKSRTGQFSVKEAKSLSKEILKSEYAEAAAEYLKKIISKRKQKPSLKTAKRTK